MSELLVEVDDVHKLYTRGAERVDVLKGIHLDVPEGEFLALMGPSGSGKTTLLNLIGGIDRATSGRVMVAGHDLTRASARELARWRAAHVGFVFQFYNLMPVLTAARNVELPLLLTNLSRAQRKEHVDAALELVGLADRAEHRPAQLSGGQEQRVGIARAIVTDPTLLLCDEPTGDLDRESATEILDLLGELNRDHGKTIIMVTHDQLAADRAGRVLHVDKGEAPRVVKYLHLVLSSLLRRKIRTTFTFLSIVVAFFLFGLLMAIQNGFDAGIQMAGQNRLLTIHRVSMIQLLPMRHLAAITSTPGVRAATHQTWFGGIYQDPKNFFAQIAVDPAGTLQIYPELIVPEDQQAKWIATRTGAVAGAKLVERFGWKVGDKIPIRTTMWRPQDGNETFEFDLVGVYRGARPDIDETTFFFNYDYLKERVGELGSAGWFIVEVEDPSRSEDVARAIDRQFANSSAETKTATEKAAMQSFAKQIGDTGAMLSAISAVVFFVILLIAGNTMAQSVRERTNELGVLKTIGFTDTAVMALVLAEAVLLSGLAGALGLALVTALAPGLGKVVEAFLPVFYVPVRAIVIGLLIATGLGLASGGVPAFLAQRLQIVEALRRR